jgi:hypothetical protein
MKKKKILVFLPDGGGLRNFAFSSFKEIGDAMGFDVHYWNNSGFPIKEKLNYLEISIKKIVTHPLTPLYSKARKDIELNSSKKKFQDTVYEDYKFPLSFKGFKNSLKSVFTLFLIKFYASEKGLKKIRAKIEKLERSTITYQQSKAQLLALQPELVFCSNQRNTQAISSLLAARDLGITTVCFIQSWDNVPKAMQAFETDYYLVWSELMQDELLKYYPFIKKEQVFVTGTPQFEPHFDDSLLQTRELFFKQQGLDCNKQYICFSGDDETTSPLDQYYLEDLAQAVRSLNSKGENLGIIFRRCPVDFSNRYDEIVATYKDVIKELNPMWEQRSEKEGFALPLKEDFSMLYNVCEHSEFVTNVCSSTVFDFVAHHKSCIYYNYEQPQLKKGIRDIGQNYRYVHFRSMPNQEAVIFCKDKAALEQLVLGVLKKEISNVTEGLKWFDTVVGKTPTKSSINIWKKLLKISE